MVYLNTCFIDVQKACDSVNHTLLRGVLVRFGVPSPVITVKDIFRDGMRGRVQLDNVELSLSSQAYSSKGGRG